MYQGYTGWFKIKRREREKEGDDMDESRRATIENYVAEYSRTR